MKNALNISPQEIIKQQSTYTNLAKEKLMQTLEGSPKAFIHTYGCQQNVSDSERMQGQLVEMGYTMCESAEDADFILFNTCAVREHAEDRVWGNVGLLKKLKKQNPNLIIALCGCMFQQAKNAERARKSFPYVDIVFGTYCRWRLPEFIYRRLTGSPRIFEISENNNDIVEGFPVKRDGSFKGWVPIMYGCNNFCTYCIVPYVRGRERSRKPEDIIAEITRLVQNGYSEITLLGQNVNSYGKGEAHGINFAKLLRMVNDIEGDFRIRFMTSHPRDCTKELIDAMSERKKVCHHLHLPFQSGSDRILKEMNRHYNRAQYLELIDYAKTKMPDLDITSDVIVGFPGETYNDFLDTVSLVKKVRYSSLFTFIFSARNGTPAAQMPDPVSREEKGKWFSELLAVQDKISDELSEKLVGRTYRVLCEGKGRGDGYIAGRTNGNSVIEFEAPDEIIGSFATVKVIKKSSVLEGELIGG